MSSPRITSFLIDAENEDKFAAHGLTARRVTQVLDNDHIVVRTAVGAGVYIWSSVGTMVGPV